MEPFDAGRIVSSEVKYAGRRVRLVVDEIDREPNPRLLREVVEHPESAAVLARTPSGELLFVEHYRHAVKKALLEIPAGVLEDGETPSACARRELEEETGFRARRMELMAAFYPSPGVFTEKMHVFFADHLEQGLSGLEEGELLRPVTLSAAQALEKISSNEIEDGKTIVAVLYAHRVGYLRER